MSKASKASLKSTLSYQTEEERQRKLDEILDLKTDDHLHWDVEGEFSRVNGL